MVMRIGSWNVDARGDGRHRRSRDGAGVLGLARRASRDEVGLLQ